MCIQIQVGQTVAHAAIMHGAATHELCFSHLFCQGAPELCRHNTTDGESLTHEACESHFPAVANFANQLAVWDENIFQKDFIEF